MSDVLEKIVTTPMPLSFDDEKLTATWGGSIRWDEVAALHASKYDAIEREAVILTFDYPYGEFIEVNVDDDGFPAPRERLRDYLPLPNDWYEQIESLSVTEGITFFANRVADR